MKVNQANHQRSRARKVALGAPLLLGVPLPVLLILFLLRGCT
jgi:hypothetical protein